jgi:hypothetical protein
MKSGEEVGMNQLSSALTPEAIVGSGPFRCEGVEGHELAGGC